MIRKCEERDFEQIWEVINDAAQIYRGIIPVDRYSEPYMSREELRRQMEEAVVFWGHEEDGKLLAVMGIQQVKDVTLIRHAYVRGTQQKRGLGGGLLAHLRAMTSDPVLIGTWQAAFWAIRFYEQHGFVQVDLQEKDSLLRKYWNIPERQIETSVVLADWKRLPSPAEHDISAA
jgi:N-acetylglutamate synthase-like GNAT family acetyltransferase